MVDTILTIEQLWIEFYSIKTQKKSKTKVSNEDKWRVLLAQISQKSFYEIDGTTMSVYGDCDLVTDKLSNSIDTVSFQYITFDRLCTLFLPKLKKLTNLSHIILKNNYLTNFDEIYKLKALTQVKSLTIEQNPICTMSNILKPFCVANMKSLTIFNGSSILDEDRNHAHLLFGMFLNKVITHLKIR